MLESLGVMVPVPEGDVAKETWYWVFQLAVTVLGPSIIMALLDA